MKIIIILFVFNGILISSQKNVKHLVKFQAAELIVVDSILQKSLNSIISEKNNCKSFNIKNHFFVISKALQNEKTVFYVTFIDGLKNGKNINGFFYIQNNLFFVKSSHGKYFKYPSNHSKMRKFTFKNSDNIPFPKEFPTWQIILKESELDYINSPKCK